MARPSETEILRFTKEIVVAHVSRNTLDSESLLDLIRNVYTTLNATQGAAVDGEVELPNDGPDGLVLVEGPAPSTRRRRSLRRRRSRPCRSRIR